MVTYQVDAIVETSVVERYEKYMKDRHIRDVLASGCFVDATLERADVGKYRIRYRAASQQDLDRYLRDHTVALRRHFAENFPTGVQLSREVWTEVVVLAHRREAPPRTDPRPH
jgi:hypothetical protein